jgi:ADP-ribosyl-[dinitrogen reductase] hydrolase
MLVEICLADSFGAGYEFTDTKPTRFQYLYHPKHIGLRLGQYTDDGQMSLGTCETMLAHEEPSMWNYSETYLDTFWRDRRDGYARRFQDFLENTRTPEQFFRKIKPHSERSGSSMRSIPIGLYPTIEKTIQQARLQAVLTHNTDGGIHAAMAVALAAHFLYHRLGSYDDLGRWIADKIGVNMWVMNYEDARSNKPGNNGIECAHAAISIVRTTNRFSDAIMRAVQMGGDTDTVASITGGLCSLTDQIEQDVPENLLRDLEDGTYGKTYLAEIDRRMFERFPRQPQMAKATHTARKKENVPVEAVFVHEEPFVQDVAVGNNDFAVTANQRRRRRSAPKY